MNEYLEKWKEQERQHKIDLEIEMQAELLYIKELVRNQKFNIIDLLISIFERGINIIKTIYKFKK